METQEERLQGTEGRHVHCCVCRGMSLWGALYFCSSCCDGEVFRQSRLVFYLLCKISAEFSIFPAALVNVDIYSFLLVPHVSSWTPAPALPCETPKIQTGFASLQLLLPYTSSLDHRGDRRCTDWQLLSAGPFKGLREVLDSSSQAHLCAGFGTAKL